MESRLWSVRESRNSNAVGFKVASSFKYGDMASLVVIGLVFINQKNGQMRPHKGVRTLQRSQ